MKTAIQQLIEFLELESSMHHFSQLPAYEKAKELLEVEKEQHEKIAIDMINIALDNLNNPNCKMEDEFKKYYNATFKNKQS